MRMARGEYKWVSVRPAGDPTKLSKDQMISIISRIQRFCFMNGGTRWVANADINGGDLVDVITNILAEYDLCPTEEVAFIEDETISMEDKAYNGRGA